MTDNVVHLASDLVRLYTDLPPAIATKAMAAAERIKVHGRLAGESVVAIGRDLLEQKAALGHGNFGRWIEAEFGWTYPSAVRFMNVAERYGDKTIKMIDLGVSAIYALAAPSTPEVVRDAAEALILDGVKITAADVKSMKTAHDEALERMSLTERTAADAVAADREQNEKALAEVKRQLAAATAGETRQRGALAAEVEALQARIKELETDPIWEVHRQAIREAAQKATADKRKKRKETAGAQNPIHKPNPALEMNLTLIGPLRVLADTVIPRISPATILAGFLDDSDRRDGLHAARIVRDFLNKLVETPDG